MVISNSYVCLPEGIWHKWEWTRPSCLGAKHQTCRRAEEDQDRHQADCGGMNMVQHIRCPHDHGQPLGSPSHKGLKHVEIAKFPRKKIWDQSLDTYNRHTCNSGLIQIWTIFWASKKIHLMLIPLCLSISSTDSIYRCSEWYCNSHGNRGIPSGKHTKNYGKSPFFNGNNGKINYKMAIFNSYVSLPEGTFPSQKRAFPRVQENSWVKGTKTAKIAHSDIVMGPIAWSQSLRGDTPWDWSHSIVYKTGPSRYTLVIIGSSWTIQPSIS